MKLLNTIQKKLGQVMCADRPEILRQFRRLKKQAGSKSGNVEAAERQIRNLLKRVESSIRQQQDRALHMPAVEFIPELPITGKKDAIIQALKQHRVIIIAGETGSGKTTQIPKFCIAAGRGRAGTIGCTQPRRIAAVTVATRIAQELGEEPGQSVGYKIRFDDTSSSTSIIKVMTDGILLAETQGDPFLSEYDTLIIDEAHERSLNIDFTLGILRTLVRKRQDLTLVITSATIDTEKFSKAFDDAPVIEVSGRMFPVDVRYAALSQDPEADQEDQGYVESAVNAVDLILRESRTGDILVFMPTEQDIGETLELIRGRSHPGVLVLPLFARLSAHEQARVFSRGPGRKIIVATNVAETSLTIPGITYVVDTGLARIPHYSPRTRTMALPVKRISRSSADQRKGRCGRVANGVCIRLYDEADYESRPLYTSPEILRSNLAEVILRMISLGLGTVSSFPFIDVPSPKSIKDGFDTLLELGAIREIQKKGKKEVELTAMGRIMARIPVDPKLSRILIEADRRGCLDEALVIASALSIADPRQRPQDKTSQADQKHAVFKDPASDFVTLLAIWNSCEAAQKTLKSRGRVRAFCKENFLSFKRLREWNDIHRQIRSVLAEHGITGEKRMPETAGTQGLKAKEFALGGTFYAELHKSLLAGYLAGIAIKKEKNTYTAARGKQVVLFPGSGIYGKAGTWIMAAEFVETSQLFARTAATIDAAWLEEVGGDLCTRTWSDPHWEKNRGEVVASEQVSLFGLVIVPERPVAYGRIHPAEAGEIFIRKALVEGDVPRPFPFMAHNLELIDGLREVEEKTRTRDILVSEEDLFLFYQQRLDRDFYNIRTFAKFLKDQQDDSFLRMTPEDVQKRLLDDEELKKYPDALELNGGTFALDYDFAPGSDRDGVTVKVPEMSAASFPVQAMDRLVPGLFEDRITALIKNLPKKERIKLLPAAEKAAIIAKEMPAGNQSLFHELSAFIRHRFNEVIPVNAWSEQGIDEHLRMRVSICDAAGREIAASRDKALLKEYSAGTATRTRAFDETRDRVEIDSIVKWDFGDIPDWVEVKESRELVYKVFPGLSYKEGKLSLRLFRSRDEAMASHLEGVGELYRMSFPRDFAALKKDIRLSGEFKEYLLLAGGRDGFQESLFKCLVRDVFGRNIRTQADFFAHAEEQMPRLYSRTREFMGGIECLCREYMETLSLLKQMALKYRHRSQISTLISGLMASFTSLVPERFPDFYTVERIQRLPVYIAGLRLRAQRAVLDPVKDGKKEESLTRYTQKLTRLLEGLTPESSREKADLVEAFFWMIEEYKISLFAQELKTAIKISPRRLDDMAVKIAGMI